MSAGTAGPLRVGVVGCGYWGPKLARNFHALPETELVAVADPDPERREHMARTYPGVRAVADLDALLALSPEAVAIATPVSTHAALACRALEAGCHVLVEKPLARSSEEARGLVREAAERGRVLMVGHTFVYNPAVELLARLVADGEVGRPYYLTATRVNLGIHQPDVNVIWDLAPHDLSILDRVIGAAPRALRAVARTYAGTGQEDVAWLHLEYANGVTATLHLSWLAPQKIRRVTVIGDRRMIVYDDVAALDKVSIYDRGVDAPPHTDSYGEFQLSYRYGDVKVPRIDWVEPLRAECAHFADCVRAGRRPRSDGEAGLEVVGILEAADRSLAAGGERVLVDQS